ncbi:MAG TPA: hypothetical protein VM681_09650 [Candidatus Thermoplasmatota archaeon]|nr:hypothetical protein [Candidatus Thermoplasmatota archaeon]
MALTWLTFECASCGRRLYSGYAVETIRHAGKLVGTEFLCADCGVETPVAQAKLQTADGKPWAP